MTSQLHSSIQKPSWVRALDNSNVSYGSANFSSCLTHSSQVPAVPFQVPKATTTLYLNCQNTQLRALMNLQKLYAAEIHFSNKDKRKQTRMALFTLLLCAYLNFKEQKFSCIVPVFQSPLQDAQGRLSTEGSSGVSHSKVAKSLPGPASTPRSKRRGARETNTHFTYSPQSKLGKLLEVNKQPPCPHILRKPPKQNAFTTVTEGFVL